MNKVKVITDSCADLDEELLTQYGIDYAKMSTVYNGYQSPAITTWTNNEAHDFYEIMRCGNRITTSQVSVDEFQKIFKKYLSEGYDIVYIGCSTKQSGSVNTGYVVANKMLSDYPHSKIYCIDSLNASIGEGMLAIEASKMAQDGLSSDEIYVKIMGMRNHVNQYVTVHSLDALRRAGRVKASAAFFGNIMGVKPILISDADGTQTPCKKVKGRQNSLCEIVSQLKNSIINPETQTIYIAHGDCSQEEIDFVTNTVKNEINCKNIHTVYVGPIIGASIGPDAIGVWGFGQEITYKVGEIK